MCFDQIKFKKKKMTEYFSPERALFVNFFFKLYLIKTHLQIPNIFSNGTEQARLMVCDHYQKHVYKNNYINH